MCKHKIPEVILSEAEMRKMMPIIGEVFTAHSEGTVSGQSDSSTTNHAPTGFRMYFPGQMDVFCPTILSWSNRALMSTPGYIESPLRLSHLASDRLNRRFGRRLFKNCKLSVLPVFLTHRAEAKVDEIIVTDIQTASHILLCASWPESCAPKEYGLESQFAVRHKAYFFTRVTPDQTHANCGWDYWLLPKQSLGQLCLSYLACQRKDDLMQYELNWKRYNRNRESYRMSMRDLTVKLRRKGYILDCGDRHCAILSCSDASRSRKVWYTETELEHLKSLATGSNVEIFELPPDAPYFGEAKVG